MTKNPNYVQLLQDNYMENLIEEQHLKLALENVDKYTKQKLREEAKALLVILYYTGCRPSEALLTKAKQITKEGRHIRISLITLKRGVRRIIKLDMIKFPLLKILYNWRFKKYAEEYLFFRFIGRSKHTRKWKKKHSILNDGNLEFHFEDKKKDYIEISYKLRYHFNKWFGDVFEGGVNPYLLRHNKFTKLARTKGVTDRDLLQFKGSRSIDSLKYYIHQSEESANKLSKLGG